MPTNHTSSTPANEASDGVSLREQIEIDLLWITHTLKPTEEKELVDQVISLIHHHDQRIIAEAERRAVEIYKAEQEVERWDDIQCPRGECKTCDYRRPRLEAAKKHLAALTAQQDGQGELEGGEE